MVLNYCKQTASCFVLLGSQTVIPDNSWRIWNKKSRRYILFLTSLGTEDAAKLRISFLSNIYRIFLYKTISLLSSLLKCVQKHLTQETIYLKILFSILSSDMNCRAMYSSNLNKTSLPHTKFCGSLINFCSSLFVWFPLFWCDPNKGKPRWLKSIWESGSSLCIHQSLQSYKLVHNGGFSNFELPLLVRKSKYLAQILCGLSYRV